MCAAGKEKLQSHAADIRQVECTKLKVKMPLLLELFWVPPKTTQWKVALGYWTENRPCVQQETPQHFSHCDSKRDCPVEFIQQQEPTV
ncbi:hypothetical protein BaRGS_00004402, partial [Batillaria attramentaria]